MDPKDFGNRDFWLGVAVGATAVLGWMEAKTIKDSVLPKPKLDPITVKIPSGNSQPTASLEATHIPAITPVEKNKSGRNREYPQF